ncbi:MAG: hypothetical protein ACOYYS_13830 [Chloroflexota bacterium]
MIPTTVYNSHLPAIIRNWPPTLTLSDAPNLCTDAYPAGNLAIAYLDDFEAELDPDWYRFEAAGGGSYAIDVSRTGTNLTPVVRLYDNDCRDLGKQGVTMANGTRLLWTNASATGWYRLLVYEAYGRSGAETGYKLTIQQTP